MATCSDEVMSDEEILSLALMGTCLTKKENPLCASMSDRVGSVWSASLSD